MPQELNWLLFLLLGVLMGALVAWFFAKTKFKGAQELLESERNRLLEEVETLRSIVQERDNLRLQNSQFGAQLEQRIEQVKELAARLEKSEKEYRDKVLEKENLQVLLAEQRTAFAKAEEKHAEAQNEIEKLNEKFTKEFENLANKILDEKSTKFTDQNKKNIEQILSPLQEKIKSFEKRVEDTHKDTIDRQSALRQQILGLKELNQQMSKETSNLTKALKGDAKMRGNWGELVLERVLEKSGLVKDSEYVVQQSHKDQDGRTVFPDVIVNLPSDKKMIIDSKVSLNAYERYVNEEEEELQERYLREHVLALKKHVNDLSAKNYHDLYRIESPDFVLLFVPIEPAFAIALQREPHLYSEAFEKNIVIVTPTTLLATLRTIDTMWQNEKQQRNAMDIANAAGALYDKFVGLSEDLIKVGSQLDTVKKSYSASMNKLTEGSGNLIGRVERLKRLGAKANKALNQKLVNRAIENDPDYLEAQNSNDQDPSANKG
ncbi:DNA recombination protein RmuC [Nonlabens xiamenensis]|uniref:DNA recombination protein RmuC n=1 Tax=Nonlabens xiamenensis TaxID=2341043 RepID=UPI000F608DDF|nr:DNA recombination protein RmuC [Nonlabens xiamenensis]